ncbi:MAG: phosphorylase [Cyanomargarita calcarea GSE-NOS-MK-12-04C]|uniref:Phosphorylase n=1 Tax=Cyanomargarita calcarea GSE-NOS-MK-12-04C TaxID=2839659 RepID=A0A951QPG6_9CYAN|nr:phosphorylase [Cyanomargarita calcarea GSE-NOS-MK-12-04C]
MFNILPIEAILVCQGAEHKAVCQGLSRVSGKKPTVVSIPVGVSVKQYLEEWLSTGFLSQSSVLVMGLCGSLNPRYGVGDVVLYDDSDEKFTFIIQHHLKERVSLVTAWTSDRFIHSAPEKLSLGKANNADVIDMEGTLIQEVLRKGKVPVATVRVVSDDCHHNMPDLTSAINREGKLETFPLALAMMRQPVAAVQLIRGSLRGLKVLQEVTVSLFSS